MTKKQIAKAILRKKKKPRGVIFPDFKVYYQVIIIETVRYWHKNRYIGHYTGSEKTE